MNIEFIISFASLERNSTAEAAAKLRWKTARCGVTAGFAEGGTEATVWLARGWLVELSDFHARKIEKYCARSNIMLIAKGWTTENWRLRNNQANREIIPY